MIKYNQSQHRVKRILIRTAVALCVLLLCMRIAMGVIVTRNFVPVFEDLEQNITTVEFSHLDAWGTIEGEQTQKFLKEMKKIIILHGRPFTLHVRNNSADGFIRFLGNGVERGITLWGSDLEFGNDREHTYELSRLGFWRLEQLMKRSLAE